MIRTALQSTGSVLLGIIVAIALLAGIEGLGVVLHPFPADFGGTREEMMDHVANYPPLVLALLGGVGWAMTMFCATWLATRLGANQHPGHGIGVGLLLLAAAIFNMSMLPYPLWYWIQNLILLPTGIYFGIRPGIRQAGAG